MKRNMRILLVLFVFTIAACIPVPVVVGPQSAGYDDQYGSGYGDEYVDVPIAYAEPYYFAPPIVVTYQYDYYTYEMVGGFVDIVFWRGGHRYRHERWNNNGRFVSDADMRSRQRHQRIRASELNRHREKLRQNHNISHPDSYYGMKPRPKQQMQQRLQQKEQRPQWGEQPKQTEQRPQWGQKQLQQEEQKHQLEQQPPKQAEQRPQWGQKQLQQDNLRQTPQQTRQRYQQKQQKLKQEKQKKIKKSFKKPEQEQDKGQEEMTKGRRDTNRVR
jgi:hypothetical protein